jgi:hypothetical protein
MSKEFMGFAAAPDLFILTAVIRRPRDSCTISFYEFSETHTAAYYLSGMLGRPL